MLATVQAITAQGQSCSARSENEILFVFPIPLGSELGLGHVIDLDPLVHNKTQKARNLTSGQTIELVLRDNNIHDLRLESGHGTSRMPTTERLRGA